MKINVYFHKSNCLHLAFKQVFGLGAGDNELVETTDKHVADIILLTDVSDVRLIYNERQLFVALCTGHQSTAKQPENICVIDALNLFGPEGIEKLLACAKAHMASKANIVEVQATVEYADISKFSKRYSVLVIDDKEENLRTAEAVLKAHAVTVCSSVEEAMRTMKAVMFDAVLTDMEMRPDKHFSALNLERYGVTETVDYGFAVMLEVTALGIPVAIVTDGNHHQSLTSAMFDHIKGATVNGQKVLFFNNIGKRWDWALKSLMEE